MRVLAIFLALFFLTTLMYVATADTVDEGGFSTLNSSDQAKYNIGDTVVISEDPNVTFANKKPCDTGFRDTLNIRALDRNFNPIDGVAIVEKHQASKTTGNPYYISPIYYTDENGTVKISVTNSETEDSKLDCVITINATMGKARIVKKITATSHPSTIDFVFPAGRLIIIAVDQRNQPLKGARVFAENRSRTIDDSGMAIFQVLLANQTVFLTYKDYKVEKHPNVNGPMTLRIEVPIYSMKATIMNDAGERLQGSIAIGTETFNSDENGIVEAQGIAGSEHDAVALYNGIEKNAKLDLSVRNNPLIVYDFTAPKISDVKTTETGDRINVIMHVTDPGKYPSGISASAVSGKYKINGGQWQFATIYARAGDMFVMEMPKQEPGSTIDMSIEAKDNDGNKQVVDAIYSVSGTPPNNGNGINGGAGGTGNQSWDDEKTQEAKGEFPLIPIIVGLLILAVVIVVFYGVFRLKNKGGE